MIIVQLLDEGMVGNTPAWLVGFVLFCGRRAPPERKKGLDKGPAVDCLLLGFGVNRTPVVMPGVWTGV